MIQPYNVYVLYMYMYFFLAGSSVGAGSSINPLQGSDKTDVRYSTVHGLLSIVQWTPEKKKTVSDLI